MRNTKVMKLLGMTLAIGLAGCATQWVNEDSSPAPKSKIADAKLKCQVDDKIYNWSSKSSTRKLLINMQKTEAEKQKMELHYDDEEKKMYDEIDACMRNQGLVKK